jgi:hypothetical protein
MRTKIWSSTHPSDVQTDDSCNDLPFGEVIRHLSYRGGNSLYTAITYLIVNEAGHASSNCHETP